MIKREGASEDYINGDPASLLQFCAERLPASFFPPSCGAVRGAAAVAEHYRKDAGHFASGGVSRFEVLHMVASPDVAYWTGFVDVVGVPKGTREQQAMRLRVTEVFRKERGHWKPVHSHADMLAEKNPPH